MSTHAEILERVLKDLKYYQQYNAKVILKTAIFDLEQVIKESPPAQRKPLTKTKVGNYLRRHAHGEVGMYRNGFKDGVAFAEAAHGIKENT